MKEFSSKARMPAARTRAGAAAPFAAAIIAAIVAVVALSGCERIAYAALNNVQLTEFEVRGDRLLMSGEINARTPRQFAEIMEAEPQITTLVEVDVPGSIDDDAMIALAYEVRRRGLDTHLTSVSTIYSGGVDLFLAGVRRTMAPGAEIGVHSWSDGDRDGAEYPRGAEEHELNRAYVEDMLGDDAFYWFTIHAAPADGIHVMSKDEVDAFGLLTGEG